MIFTAAMLPAAPRVFAARMKSARYAARSRACMQRLQRYRYATGSA